MALRCARPFAFLLGGLFYNHSKRLSTLKKMNHKQQKERVNLTRINMEFLKIPAPTKVPKKNGLKNIKKEKEVTK